MLELSKPTESRYIPFMMKQNAFHLAKKMAVMLVFLYIASLAQEAFAQSRVKGQYATSRSPVYQVGDYNRKILNLSIGYIGPNGQGITGIAQKGYNLYDPQGVAEDERTYHFFNQGFSNCRVYVAVTPRPRNR
jgi:hypothetical protein